MKRTCIVVLAVGVLVAILVAIPVASIVDEHVEWNIKPSAITTGYGID